MELTKIKAFYSVAKACSFVGADLDVSPSVLSRHVQDLESLYEVKVFHRTKKGVFLTPSGKWLFGKVEKVLIELKCIEDHLKSQCKALKEEINLYIPTSWVLKIFLKHISKFRDANPNILVNIITDESLPDLHSLESCNIAVLPYVPNDEKLIRRHLADYTFSLFASHEYLKTFGTPKDTSSLKIHRLIGHSKRIPGRVDLDWFLKINKKDPMTPFIRVNQPYEAAKNDIGIVTLVKENKHLNEDNDLTAVLPELEGPKGSSYIIYSEHQKESRAVKIFTKFISEVVAKDFS